ncbi:MAG: DUF4384 domain-containing protein [Proteobacteria bacterium]|nr:DUF4384 domain-containing protein [Pseudomonadota bacterium]
MGHRHAALLPIVVLAAALMFFAGARPVSAQQPAGATERTPAQVAPQTPGRASEGEGQPAATPRPVAAPADPAAAAAYAVLEKHCARCHQGGRLNRAEPAAAFGNVLRLDELASLPHLVLPGNPDGSRLYSMTLRHLMPIDANGVSPAAAEPSRAEIAAIRTWIANLAPRPQCRDRRPVATSDYVTALGEVAAATGEDPKKLRFLSIAHLHNGCARFDALAAYRQAVVRLINSLSWKPTPIAVPPIDIGRTLFKINLDDLGWLPEHWERIMASGSDPLGLVAPMPPDVRKPFGTEIPIARADWFAETVLTAPLYYEVLGFPGTGPEIRKILQLDTAATTVLRGGVTASRFAMRPSLIERLRSRSGAFWQAYNQFADDTTADLSALAAAAADTVIPAQAGRMLFQLPNGLPAFAIVGQRGDRLDALPPRIAAPGSLVHGEVRSGLDCLACHGRGPAAAEIPELAKPVADAAAGDRANVAEGLRRLGLDPDLTLDGVEPVVALAREYARPVDGTRAAAELGRSLAELSKASEGADTGATVVLRRLVQGLVARAEVEARAAEVRALFEQGAIATAGAQSEAPATRAAGSSPTEGVRPIDPGPGLILYSDKPKYRKGDHLNLVVKATGDCHLTVISVDQRGRATVIFPSDFETNAHLLPGQELKLPGSNAPYAFRLNESGREAIVATCNDASAGPDGIKHDFERQRFTDLGTYANFLAGHPTTPAAEQATPELSASGRRAVERTHARFARRGRSDTMDAPPTPEQTSRTAILIEVE